MYARKLPSYECLCMKLQQIIPCNKRLDGKREKTNSHVSAFFNLVLRPQL